MELYFALSQLTQQSLRTLNARATMLAQSIIDRVADIQEMA